jgi:hypothetical protein
MQSEIDSIRGDNADREKYNREKTKLLEENSQLRADLDKEKKDRSAES